MVGFTCLPRGEKRHDAAPNEGPSGAEFPVIEPNPVVGLCKTMTELRSSLTLGLADVQEHRLGNLLRLIYIGSEILPGYIC